MKKIAKLLLFIGVFAFSSCELDYLDSPNDVTLSSANASFLLNRIQIDFAGFYQGVSDRGARVTRIFHQAADTYEISHQAVSQNGTWNTAYSTILQDIKSLKELAEPQGFKRHLGIAKTLEAYVLLALVDSFGDVPWSQALDITNFNPAVDAGSSVYAAALALLIEAKADFQGTSIGTPNDYFYGNNYTKWTRLVNTLMLKHYLNLRLINASGSTSDIQALVTENNLLQSGDDFIWRYGKSTADPDSRHPNYQYPNGGGAYQSTFFMWHVTEAKKTGTATPGDNSDSPDPRANYYFYRQSGTNPTLSSEKECITDFPPLHYAIDMPWCMAGVRGYWGRDHLDPDGIPPDGLRRTLYGVYPTGNVFDDNTPGPMSTAKTGNGGAGLQPIMLAAFVDFMLAETALKLGVGGDANVNLLAGVQKHIDYVRTWSLTTNEATKINTFSPTATHNAKRDAYIAIVDNLYDNAATDDDRMRVIAREYWISLFANGVEAYNLYRRTGMPDNMQPGQIPNFGKFPRTFFYPNDFVVRNSSVDQKADHDVQVFWDNNPGGFIN